MTMNHLSNIEKITSSSSLYRIFFAIDLPENIQNAMDKLILQLKNNNNLLEKQVSHLHITLQFLAAIQSKDIPELVDLINLGLKQVKSFELAFGKVELFPSVNKPRVVAMTVSPQKTLLDVVERIRESLLKCGYKTEKMRFRGHLSLFKTQRTFSLENRMLPKIEPMPVREVTLYRSILSQTEPTHIPLAKFMLCS